MPGRFCTGGEELQLKERGQIRKNRQGNVGDRRSASLGDGSARGEELQLKERGQIRKNRQGNVGERRSASLGDSAPAAKNCS
ncbi:hypothetical protein [Bacillus sp. PM43]|uniref:hypothetical protein n=1 Tax=Bacillus sp. PM43 TaxID=3414494 RepID=UPI003DAA1A98